VELRRDRLAQCHQQRGDGLFPDTGPVTLAAFAQMTFQVAGVDDFADTVSGFTTKIKVPMTATPATGSVSTPFTLTRAAAPPPAATSRTYRFRNAGANAASAFSITVS
jgi:hypothetical protein